MNTEMSTKKSKDDIVILYVEKYEPKDGTQFNPSLPKLEVGEIYRACRRPQGRGKKTIYQVLTSMKAGGQGVILKTGLTSDLSTKGPLYEAIILDKKTIKSIDLTDAQMEKVIEWGEMKNEDMMDILGEGMPGGDKVLDAQSEPNPKDITKEAFDRMMMDENIKLSVKDHIIGEALDVLEERDEEMYDSIIGLLSYLASTYGDKYAAQDNPLDTKAFLYGPNGKAINIFQAAKYMGRYNTEGFQKSEQPVDLMKAIHYLLFELVRKTRR